MANPKTRAPGGRPPTPASKIRSRYANGDLEVKLGLPPGAAARAERLAKRMHVGRNWALRTAVLAGLDAIERAEQQIAEASRKSTEPGSDAA